MSERNGYEHGVPCWIDGRPPRPDGRRAFYTRAVRLGGRARGELHSSARCAAATSPASSRGDEPAWRTHIWVESADETAARRTDAGGTRRRPRRSTSPGVGRTAVARRPRRRRVHRLPSPTGHRGAQVVNEPARVGDERARDARPRGRARPSTAPSSAGRPTASRPATRGDAVAPARLRRRRAGAAGPADVVAVGDAAATTPRWDVDFWVDDVDADRRASRRARRRGARRPVDTPIGRRAVLADPQGATFSVSRVVPA